MCNVVHYRSLTRTSRNQNDRIAPEVGLCYPRAPAWCPYRLQFYFNGHNWLASEMRQKGVQFEAFDNSHSILTVSSDTNREAAISLFLRP